MFMLKKIVLFLDICVAVLSLEAIDTLFGSTENCNGDHEDLQ